MNNDFFIKLDSVILAHELVTRSRVLSDYTDGRRVAGISFVISGKAEYRLTSGERINVSDSDVLLFDSNVAYLALTRSETYHHYTVNFLPGAAFPSELVSSAGITVLKGARHSVYAKLFSELSDVWRKKQFAFEIRAASLLYELLFEFFTDLHAASSSTASHRLVKAARDYIDEHYTEDISVPLLAKICGISETHLRREFLRLFALPPMKYCDRVRLLHAKDELLTGAYTVSEVAYRCGFSDVSYFARFFKKHTGVTPTEFKKSG